MRILHLNDAMDFRGGEAQTWQLGAGLYHRGQFSMFAVQPGSMLEKKALTDNIPVISFPMRSEIDLCAAYRIRRAVKEHGIECLHAHTAHAHALASIALTGITQPSLIVSRRVVFGIKKNWFSALKYSIRVDAYIAISYAVKKVLIEGGVPAEKIEVVHSGIALDKFNFKKSSSDLRKQMHIPRDAIIIGKVAALTREKDHETLLRAAKIVCHRNNRAIFILAGSGECETRLKQCAEKWGLDRRIQFAGQRDDIGDMLQLFDIFAFSSRQEGLGTSILDAMLAGLPVVATAAGGW